MKDKLLMQIIGQFVILAVGQVLLIPQFIVGIQ